jgi:acetylornithine deacetylase
MVEFNAVASRVTTSIEMLARLVGFNTVSHNSNLDLIGFARAWLEAHGASCRLSFDPTGQKANLHAIIGPVQAGGLAFAGHVDTVSAEGQTWSGDPLKLRRQHGRLIGRGACDMKGFVASLLAAVPDIAARKLCRPVHLLLTYDEEVGYHGARRLVADLKESGLRPAVCVIGEASEMRPILAQKGRFIVEVTARGHAAHSSEAHRGVNAVHAAAEAIAWLVAESRRRISNGPHDAGFEPPYTTLQVADIISESLPNTVPALARFTTEWRNIPGDDSRQEFARFKAHVANAIEPEMQTQCAGAGFQYDVRLDLAALSLPPEHELARAACKITGVPRGGKVSYCSEGSLYQPAGIASMVCGPGQVSQVHQPDEWISENQLSQCDNFIRRLVDRLAV